MKLSSLLIIFCALFSLSAVAQTTPAAEKKTQRITITTTKVDEQGQTITETFIAEGEEPVDILEKMAINPEVIQQVRIEGDLDKTKEERLFLYRSAGDNIVIEGTLNENALQDEDMEKIIITRIEDGTGLTESKKIMTVQTNGPKYRGHGFSHGPDHKVNCAALGVFVGRSEDVFGARINGLIEKGGAQEAGMKSGDVIKKIDEFDVSDFASLHFALSHFRSGDEVAVRYERDNQYFNANVLLKDWAQLPGHEFRSRTDCAEPEVPIVVDSKREDVDDPTEVYEFQTLELPDAQIFPNPTNGQFAFSFSTKPGPLFISITDATGKIVYREKNDNATGYYNRQIDIKEYPQGNYIISVVQNDHVFTKQIAKQ